MKAVQGPKYSSGRVYDLHVGKAAIVDVAVCQTLVQLVDAAWLTCNGDLAALLADKAGPFRATMHSLEAKIVDGSKRDDFKMLLRRDELCAMVGDAAYLSMTELLGREPDAIALRRTVGTGKWIGFHTDDAGRTVQVPLPSPKGSECTGGNLVFLCGNSGEMRCVDRVPGVPLCHEGDAVHGVTALTSGVRYGLFLLSERECE